MKKANPVDARAVDLVIFDLDGTLVDSREDIARAVNQGIVSLGGEKRPSKDIIPHIGRPLVEIFQDLLPVGLHDFAHHLALCSFNSS